MTNIGKVFWVTGLAGSGKTTIGRALHSLLVEQSLPTVFLDGDDLRVVFGNNKGYDIEDRRELAMQYARLCKLLTDQGVNVVCATISMFSACRDWCRDHVAGYREIYIRVPVETLIRRDKNGLYSRAMRGEISNVVGVDLPFEEPEQPSVVIENKCDQAPVDIAQWILKNLDLTDKRG